MERRSSERTTHRRNCAFNTVGKGRVVKCARPAKGRKYDETSVELSVPNQTSKKNL